MNVCMYVCMYVCMCVCVCMCVHVCVRVCVCVCMYMYVCMHACMHTCMLYVFMFSLTVNGNYRFLMVIVGLTYLLCVHVHLIHFFTIDQLGSKLTCYLFFPLHHPHTYITLILFHAEVWGYCNWQNTIIPIHDQIVTIQTILAVSLLTKHTKY